MVEAESVLLALLVQEVAMVVWLQDREVDM